MEHLKKTVNLSRLDLMIRLLAEQKIKGKIELSKIVSGRGYNDIDEFANKKKKYYIRKLFFLDYVLLEKIIQTSSKDLDDYYFSEVYRKNNVPKNWNPIIRK